MGVGTMVEVEVEVCTVMSAHAHLSTSSGADACCCNFQVYRRGVLVASTLKSGEVSG